MGKRIVFGLSMIAALVSLLALDHSTGQSWSLYGICMALTLACIHELRRMFSARGLPIDAGLLAVTAVAVLSYVQLIASPPWVGALAHFRRFPPEHLFWVPPAWRELTLLLPLFVVLLFAVVGLRRRDVSNISARVVNNLGVFLYLIFPVALILWLRRVPETGVWLLYLLLFCSRFGDVGAYFLGRAFGRVKLIPHLSAGKTRAGAFFGLLFSAGAGAVVCLWANAWTDGLNAFFEQWWYGAIAGLFIGVAAQAGDLIESGFKRAAGIKDSGDLVPGFGGVFDIVDNFMLTAPLLIVVLALWPA